MGVKGKSKNGVSTDEELVSQNAHHVELAADVVDISDVKAFILSGYLFWERTWNKRYSARIPFWLPSWHRALSV